MRTAFNNVWLNVAMLMLGLMVLSYIKNLLMNQSIEGMTDQEGGDCYDTSNCTPSYGLMRNSIWSPNTWLNNITSYFGGGYLSAPYPYFRPYWYRNVGEMIDPYYPRYYQTYHNDLPYFYYNNKSFDNYRKEWVSKPGNRCKRYLKRVPSATKSFKACKHKTRGTSRKVHPL